MKRLQQTGAGLLGAAVVAAVAGSATVGVPSATGETAARLSDAARLLDPAYVAGAICGKGGARAAGPTAMRFQVAALDADRMARLDPDGPPLFDNLGGVTYRVATANPQAQRYFDQGLRLVYAFNHAEAVRSFRKAQKLDPGCAMCFWGEALTFGPNINMPMAAEALKPALAAVERARALAAGAPEKERTLIAAMARRYSPDPTVPQAAGDLAFAVAMADAAGRYPDDDEIAVLYAESLMNLAPWDYWEADRKTAKGKMADGIGTLERVLARNPNHPAAIHLYIHAVEASDTPQRAEPGADRLATLMPGAGHLVHMPSHIYYRIGRYKDSLAVNREAIAADEAYLRAVKAEGLYPGGYYPHNVHFLMVSAQIMGEAATALAAADKLAAVATDQAARIVPWVQPIKAAPYFAYAQLAPPQQALALPEPAADLPFVVATWRYARGEAHAAMGDLARAGEEADAIARLVATGDFRVLTDAGIPAAEPLRVGELVVRARIAQGKGDLAGAERLLTEAVALQDRLPYFEPPFFYYPVRQTLGATLLTQGKAAEAERAFQAALLEAPNNGQALWGLREAQTAQGDRAGAAATQRLLDNAWAGDPNDPRLSLKRL
jgi:tetratricopeptide (TPR) repeat protein